MASVTTYLLESRINKTTAYQDHVNIARYVIMILLLFAWRNLSKQACLASYIVIFFYFWNAITFCDYSNYCDRLIFATNDT